MPKYLFTASYTQEGVKGLLKEGGSSRKETLDNLIRGMGGSMEAFYYAFGGDDAVVIVEFPDDATATGVSLAISASGAVKNVQTTVLIDPETIDEAIKKTVDYRPPGQ